METGRPIVEIANKRKDGSLPEYFKILLVQQPYSRRLYSYICDTIISNHDNTNIASQITSNVTFSVEKRIQNNKSLINFEIADTFISNTNPEGQKIAEMGKIFALPINNLIMELNPKGKIKDILNKSEIARKWQELFNQISQGMDENIKEKIKEEGDRDYLNPTKAVKGSFLHEIFFLPIFGTDLTKTTAGRFTVNNKVKLLENMDADYTFTGQVKYVDENIFIAEYNDSYDDSFGLMNKARKIYKELIPKKSRFHQEVKMVYKFDINRGLPFEIEVLYVELIEGALKYTQMSTFKLLS